MELTHDVPAAYLARHRSDDIRAASQSGGLFTALSDPILAAGGVVYGCAMTEDFGAAHIRAEDAAARDRMRGSKYIQSRMGDTFRQVRRDLEDGRTVFFTGTPCQVAGLRGYLRRPYARLFCADLICFGTGSPRIWRAFLRWEEQRHGADIQEAVFRDKPTFGWRKHMATLRFQDGTSVHSGDYKALYQTARVLRPSCHVCPFPGGQRPGDVTMGDFWGVEHTAPAWDDDRGVSLVLVHNEQGRCLLDAARDALEGQAIPWDAALQPRLQTPTPRPRSREELWRRFHAGGFAAVAEKLDRERELRKQGIRDY